MAFFRYERKSQHHAYCAVHRSNHNCSLYFIVFVYFPIRVCVSVTHFAELPLFLAFEFHTFICTSSLALSLFLSDIVREFHSLFIRNNLFERCFSSGLRAQFAGFPPFQFVRLDTLIINLLYRRSRTVGSVIVSLRTNVCHN